MESSRQPGKVNISKSTYGLLKDNPKFSFVSMGQVDVKGKGSLEMYYAEIKKA